MCNNSLQLYLPLFASKETESDSIKTSLVSLYRETDCTRLEETIALKVGGMKTWDVLEEQNVPPPLVKAVSFTYGFRIRIWTSNSDQNQYFYQELRSGSGSGSGSGPHISIRIRIRNIIRIRTS